DGLADRRDELAKFRSAAAGLEIETVTDLGGLVPYRETAFEGFGIPVAAAKLFLTESLLALPGVICLLGRIDGAPACTSMLIQTGTVAGIYWVATHERFRGRGLGAAMTAAAAEAGLPYGAELASLQASRMGRPVYQRMGFETVGTYVDFRRAT
ncbi:MAG: GNAT family N-acetyltransferase, partial [Proteobacteria bacterium]|nr:GNAT family N-acetyltransferase [Pseudomonadota bacterium]